MRNFYQTVVDKDHQRFTHLDWGCSPVTLTDADRNGITLVPWLFKPFLLPLAGWHIAGAFFSEIDARIFAVAEFAHPL